MAEDWAIDVRKYVPDADEAAIAGIVRHCGIALRSRDASLVSFTDPAETDLVRESYCRKKLGLTHSDEELDAAIARVGERMKEDRTKNRVTVYYLLAEAFGKLGLFVGATAAAAAPAEPTPEPAAPLMAPVAPPPPPVAAPPPPVLAVAAAAPLISAPAHAQPKAKDDGNMFGTAFAVLGGLGVLVVVAATAGSLIGNTVPSEPAMPAAPVASPPPAVVATAPAIPQGSGVVAGEVAGKPQLSVYFDTAKADVSPEFEAAAAPIKAWMDSNSDARLAVSGFNDPRGDAAFNAELSKNRAQNVAAALAAMGVPADRVDLEKPPETSDATTSLENARRVDIVVKDSL